MSVSQSVQISLLLFWLLKLSENSNYPNPEAQCRGRDCRVCRGCRVGGPGAGVPLLCSNIRPLLSITFPKDSESLKILDIRLREVGAKRLLNGTSKVNRQTHRRTDRQTHRRTDISTYRKHRPRRPML